LTTAEARVAELFASRFLRGYAHGKLRRDPVYRAVLEILKGTSAPIYDVGCGVGLLEFYLRENGVHNWITGIDHDSRKIAQATAIASRYDNLRFASGDARAAMPAGSTVVLLDVLHYFSAEEQRQILENAAASAPLVVIRDAVRDGTMRYRLTAAQERFSRAIRWLRAERLNFPAREEITSPFAGFTSDVKPLWGNTPFNNYLFVFRRSGDGITKR
jgi:SAM-dependent methyltransferase